MVNIGRGKADESMHSNLIVSAETEELSPPIRMQIPDDLIRRFEHVVKRDNAGKSSIQKSYRRDVMQAALTIGLTWIEVDPTMSPTKVRAARNLRAHLRQCLDEIEAAANELQGRVDALKQAIANLR
jgi:hypothetical protein